MEQTPYACAPNDNQGLPPLAFSAEEAGKRAMRPAAISLLICSILGICFALRGAVFWITELLTNTDVEIKPMAYQAVAFATANITICTLVLLGAISMLRASSRWLALTGVCCALIPICGPCYILAVPFGVWAMVVMHRPEAIAAFEQKSRGKANG